MVEMPWRKGNISTHSMWMPGVEKDKDADLGLRQDGSGANTRGETERYRDPRQWGWTAEQPLINLNERDGGRNQWAWVLVSQQGTHLPPPPPKKIFFLLILHLTSDTSILDVPVSHIFQKCPKYAYFSIFGLPSTLPLRFCFPIIIIK